MTRQIAITVNATPRQIEAAPGTSLLEILRNTLGLKGSRYGCGLEQCGACMVLIDGAAVHACTRDAATLDGAQIVTIEGLAGAAHPLLAAFLDEQAGQCGYCLSGIIVSAAALLAANPDPDRDQIAAALDRHLCRCGAQPRILRAVARAGETLRQGAAS